MRKEAEGEKRPLTIRSPWRDRDPAEAPAGAPYSDPAQGTTRGRRRSSRISVQGRVTFANKDLDDLIILRSDGNPTYNLAVVVDDHDMGVTHVIRGVDHLTNAARQTQIYDAMGWRVPVWAHVPLIHGADGAKLSKRHGAQGVEDYRSMGYLPVALRNYLVRLGWSHGDDEIMSTEQLIEWFDIDDINRARRGSTSRSSTISTPTTSATPTIRSCCYASKICSVPVGRRRQVVAPPRRQHAGGFSSPSRR